MNNTALSYKYRDYAGYSTEETVIFEGSLTLEEVNQIKNKFLSDMTGGWDPEDDIYGQIIPGQIGLDDLQDKVGNEGREWDEDLDHIFHVVTDIYATGSENTHGLVKSFMDRVLGVSWDLFYEPSLLARSDHGMN
jgi:hypothetical protein